MFWTFKKNNELTQQKVFFYFDEIEYILITRIRHQFNYSALVEVLKLS